MKLKYRSEESPPQAKFFYRISHSHTRITNGIVNAIYRGKAKHPQGVLSLGCSTETGDLKHLQGGLRNSLDGFDPTAPNSERSEERNTGVKKARRRRNFFTAFVTVMLTVIYIYIYIY